MRQFAALISITAPDPPLKGHDGRGNLSSANDGAYAYTAENKLFSSPGGWYAYDPAGRLFWENAVTGRFYDGDRLIRETGAKDRRHVHGDGVDAPLVTYENARRRWLHADERGCAARSGPRRRA